MHNTHPATNQMTDEMLRAALTRLNGREASDISKKTGIPYNEENNEFSFSSLGKSISVSYPGFYVSGAVSDWHMLVILHYMDIADGRDIAGEIMSLSQVKDGIIRGGGFDRDCENIIRTKIGYYEPTTVKTVCTSLGAKLIQSNADICAVFDFLPNYPVTLKIWFADEEIPGSGRMFVDKSADSYLSIEDAVTAGMIILENIISSIA